jgi:tetratricopeptide (TPR) repeat protein
VEEYGRCLELAPGSAEARYNLGALLRRIQRPEQAIDHLRIADGLTPDDPQTNWELGLAYADAGGEDQALHHLRRAVALSPNNVEFRAHLANLTGGLRRKR